jgi:hypothetical protein
MILREGLTVLRFMSCWTVVVTPPAKETVPVLVENCENENAMMCVY